MTSRGILFSAPMALAVVGDRKTQTRRVVKGLVFKPEAARAVRDERGGWHFTRGAAVQVQRVRCPYGVPGDELWVRETWRGHMPYDDRPPSAMPHDAPVWYVADGGNAHPTLTPGKVRVSIHMPEWATRKRMIISDIRVERLQDISEADALAEGVTGSGDKDVWPPCAKAAYQDLWDDINGFGSWAGNPWVWVIDWGKR